MTDDYGSHIPFLRWIGQHITPIRGVLELGAGMHSTPLWLDRTAFPDVERVVSVEQDVQWLPHFTDDARLQVVHTEVAMFAEVLYNVEPYDLIFIDNGSGPNGESERWRTIKAIMKLPVVPLVVVHDWENATYRDAAAGHYQWVMTDDMRPQTALLLRGGAW